MNKNLNGSDTGALSVKQRRLASALCDWEGLLQKNFHDSVEAQTIMFFLHIASKSEAVDLSSIGQALGLSKAAASRNYYRLADGKTGDDGLDLIKSLVDYSDRRRMPLVLTDKGTEVAKELTGFILTRFTKIVEKDEASE